MPWISDVVPYTTILSTWGNNIRDHAVHVFASKAERDAQAVPKDGMICHTTDTDVTYIRVNGQWWVLQMPWRDYTAIVWHTYAGQGTWSGATILQTVHARWRQAMGDARIMLYLRCAPVTFNVDLNVRFYVPPPIYRNGNLGTARLFSNHSGLINGGFANTFDANAVMVGNAGKDQPPNAVHFALSGNSNFDLDADLSYETSPTFD